MLAKGAPDILDLALDTGYESHEAFSRAFRAQFGATPEMVRRKASTEELTMIGALNIPQQGGVALEPPRPGGTPPPVVAFSALPRPSKIAFSPR